MFGESMRVLKQVALFLLDILLSLSTAVVLAILLTGGGVFHAGSTLISATHARNLITIVTLVTAARGYWGRSVPFLGLRRLEFRVLPGRCLKRLVQLRGWLQSLDQTTARRIVTGILVLSAVIKLANSWFYYGFYSGDDVEIHEMTLAALLSWDDWQAWNLRCAFYPMAFIYPAQAIFHSLGVREEALLVFSGRTVVVLFSLLGVVLVYKTAKAIYGSLPVGICAVSLYAASHLDINFGSSVLPRTVAATFVLLCVWLLERFPRSWVVVIAAGVALGIGSSIRFSEALFIGCVVLYLVVARRFQHALIVGAAAMATSAVVVGVSDLLYWGTPFSSFLNLFEYTLLEGASSRGYQPFYFYVATAGSWGNYLIAALVVYSLRAREWKGAMLALLPIAILSVLPHKELRYLVPVLPFVCILAGRSFWMLLTELSDDRGSALSMSRRPAVATVLTVLLVSSLLFEIDGYRFRRYESAVDAARYVRGQPGAASVGVEQLWRAGGRIYLWRVPTVADISFERSADREYIRSVLEARDLDYVALNASDVERYSYDELIRTAGYAELPLASPREREAYRLYERRPQRE